MEQLDGSSLIHILTHISGNKISSGRLRKNYGLELSEAQILRYRNKEQSGFPAGVTPKNFADTITKINEECYLGTADELIQRITEIIEEDLKAPGISSHLKESYCDVKGKKGEKEALSVFLKKLHAFCNGRKPFSKKPKVPPKVFSIIILASTGDLQEDIDGISSFITRDLGVPYKNINPNFSFRIIVNPSINEIQGYNDDTLYCVFVNECVETDLLDLYNSLVTQKEASDMRNIIAFIKKPASGEGRHESVEKFQDQY